MKLILLTVAIVAACIVLLSVRIIFGRHKEFLHGHACRHHRQNEAETGRDLS